MLKKLTNHKTFFFFLGIFFLILFLYQNNLNAFFVSDDFDWITVSKDRNPLTFFTTNYIGKIGGGSYGPMVNLVFYFTHKIGGLNPLPYHLVSILFHFGNIVLIFLLTKYFFNKKTAYLASLLFAVYFNNSEAVAWIAVIPHLGATFFFLLAIYLWLKFFDSKKNILLIFSLISFLISLMFKEISISLPLILIILFLVKKTTENCHPLRQAPDNLGRATTFTVISTERQRVERSLDEQNEKGIPPLTSLGRNDKTQFIAPLESPTRGLKRGNLLILGSYFFILAIYLSLRFYTTHLSTGYYGDQGFDFNYLFYLKNSYSYIVTLLFSGELRSQIRIFTTGHFWLFTTLFISILWLIILKMKNSYSNKLWIKYFLTPLFIIFIPIIVYLPLSMNPLNNEGERYLYLPSTIIVIFFSCLLTSLHSKYKTITSIFLIILIFSSSIILYQKNQTWYLSSTISKKIISDLKNQIDGSPKKIIFLSLPDNLSGTQIFRNAIKEAVDLFYPNNNLDIKTKQVYTVLNEKNWNAKNLNWGERSDGIIAKTTDSKNIITGLDRQEDDEIIFELWGYDYQYFTTNTISVQFKDRLKKELVDKKAILLYFDDGGLQTTSSTGI
jgi:hypothetical protein